MACTSDTTDFRGGVWGFVRSPTTSGGSIVTVGPAIQIRWVDADLSLLETHPLTPGLVLAAETLPPVTTTRPAETGSPAIAISTTSSSIRRFTTMVSNTAVGEKPETQPLGQLPPSSTQISGISEPTVSSSITPGAIPSIQSTTNGIMLPLLSILILFPFAVLICLLFWRYRGNNSAIQELRTWYGGGRKKKHRGNPFAAEMEGSTPRSVDDIAELGISHRYGTSANPAELDGKPVALKPPQASWVRRISRIISIRSRRTGVSSTRPSSQYSDTTFSTSDRSSADWETFAKDKYPSKLTVPVAAHQKKAETGAVEGDEGSGSPGDSLEAEAPKRRMLSLVSDGTFGGDRWSALLSSPAFGRTISFRSSETPDPERGKNNSN
jgi:hypothetical protein